MTSASAPAGRTILVTGGRGRLGGVAVRAMRGQGTRVLSLSRAPGGHADDRQVDVGDVDALLAAVDGQSIDAVVHLAAVLRGHDIEQANARMDAAVAALIRLTQPRSVVFTSTGGVYGLSAAGVAEDAPAVGTSPYARSRLASEHALTRLSAELPAMAVTTLRVFNIAGPQFDDSLVQRLLNAAPDSPARVVAPDRFVRDYVHQSDVVRALLASIDRPARGYRVVNVGAGVPVSTRRLLGGLQISDEAWIEVDGDPSVNWSDNRALTSMLGVQPRTMPDRSWGMPEPVDQLLRRSTAT